MIDYDVIMICGDSISRLGILSESINVLGEIPQRQVLDKTTNHHGHTFVESLNDAKFCILNEDCVLKNDGFKSMSTRGKTLVDYICIPHDCFQNCSNYREMGHYYFP